MTQLLAPLYGTSLHLKAPAKINLRLKITGRREDGYHLLSMLNMTTGFSDEITIRFLAVDEPEVTLQVSGKYSQDVPAAIDENLASRAALLILEKVKAPLHIKISLEKNIPSGAGLGGGSSDAATILRALAQELRQFYPELLTYRELARLAVSLGADVSYLMCGGLAQVTGIGEIVEPLPSRFIETLPCCLILPGESLMTRAIFDRAREKFEATLRPDHALDEFCKSLRSVEDPATAYDQLVALIRNDLEEVVCEVSPQIASLLERLRAMPEFVGGVTGSGSALFTLPKALKYNKEGLTQLRNVFSDAKVRVVSTTLLANS